MLDRYTHHTKQTIINVYTQVDYTFRLHTDHTPIHNTVIDQTTFHSHTTLSSDRGFPGIHISRRLRIAFDRPTLLYHQYLA